MPFFGYAQCAGIDFFANETEVCAPKLVRFYAQNVPGGSSISWNFGFGENIGKDTGQNIYTTAGAYTITLKVVFSDGVTVCTVSKPNYIKVYNAPIPSFNISRNVLCSGVDTVTITDNSVGGIGREWVVSGLSLADTSKSIVHAFNSSGFKDVLLILKSANCATTYYKVDSAVRIYSPLVVDFTADNTVGCAPAAIKYTPTTTAGHTIANYSWTFGGGSPSTSNQNMPTITYNTAGSFSSDLFVTNTDGCTATVSKSNYLQMGDTINFTVIPSKNSICRSEVVKLEVSDPSLPGIFTWSLGNGVPQNGSTDKSQLVKFNDTGYQFYAVKRRFNGCLSEKSFTKEVFIRAPLSNFSIINSVECDPNERIYVFNRSKIDPKATNTYRWNLYDPNGSLINTSTDSIPIFSTNSNGIYGLELIVSSSIGCADTLRQDNIFRRTGISSLIILPEVSCPGGNVSFLSTSPVFSSAEPNNYIWTIYDTDGTTVLHTQNTGVFPKLNYSFNKTGTFGISLIVFNSKCRDTLQARKTIDVVSPTTNIAISDVLPCVKTPISVSANTSPSIITPGYTYNWSLTNNNNPTKQYTSVGKATSLMPDTAGIYTLRTIVQWGTGCSDTVTSPPIAVSGVAFTIANSNNSDCIPLASNAAGNIIFNHNYKNAGNTAITYNWASLPAGGVFSNPNAINTPVVFTTNGVYGLRLIATNGSGCADTAYTQAPIYAGVTSNYTLSKTAVCVGEVITVNPLSQYKPDRFQWFSSPSGAIFTPSASVEQPQITFPDSGKYIISMVASKRNACFDTVYTPVNVVKTIAAFTSNDTLNYCAPTNVKYRAAAINADTLVWDFGDGKNLTTPNVDSLAYIYFKNSTPQGFTVKLKAINALGCVDSLTRFGYVHIDGPVPDFKINLSKGCAPLAVTIIDNSLSYTEYYFDYGDGSAFDTTGNPGTHIYNNDISSNEISKFKPSLFLLDPLGCFSETKYPFDIEVYKPPVVNFMADTLQGCVPLTVRFTDSSKYAQQYQWDFNNDGFIDDTAKNPIYTYTTAGFKTPKLKARSQYGCIGADSAINYINVFNLPNADFSFVRNDADTAFIYYDFINQSSNFNTLQWFVDTNLVETLPNFTYPFRDTGNIYVKLIATSGNGCVDSTDTLLYITPDYFFYIPNAFTPNGRGGNETFVPYAPIWARKYVMRIFNRYGQLLYETNQVANGWDGNFNDYPVQEDVYLYSIEYMDIYSKWHIFNGTVLLIR